MSKRLLFVLGAAMVTAGSNAVGQPPPAGPDSARERLERLDSLLTKRQAAYDSLRRAEANRVVWVELREPPFAVRTTRDLAPVVAEALRIARAAVAEVGGDPLRQRFAGKRPMIGADVRRMGLRREWITWITPDSGSARWIGARIRSAARPSASDIALQLVHLSERAVSEGADSALSAWLKSPVPLATPSRTEWEAAYTELATAPSSAARRCRAGEKTLCLTALGVTRVEDSWLDAWYAPGDYRALLATTRVPSSDTALKNASQRCLRNHEQPACAFVARGLPESSVPMPLSAEVRRLIVSEVLRAGGPHALERLLAARGPIESRLAAAAGMPTEEAAARWLARVTAAHPETVAPTPTLFVATLAWCGVLTVAAVLRRNACS